VIYGLVLLVPRAKPSIWTCRRAGRSAPWQPDEALPTVAALADHCQVSRATIGWALRSLEDGGWVRVVPLGGTFAQAPAG
jgi:DNA-binding FadR family transcriptional regulator